MIDYEVLSLLIHNCSLVTTKNATIAFFSCPLPGVKNGTSKYVDLGKFWPDLKSRKRF